LSSLCVQRACAACLCVQHACACSVRAACICLQRAACACSVHCRYVSSILYIYFLSHLYCIHSEVFSNNRRTYLSYSFHGLSSTPFRKDGIDTDMRRRRRRRRSNNRRTEVSGPEGQASWIPTSRTRIVVFLAHLQVKTGITSRRRRRGNNNSMTSGPAW
jgi:hypothetical protein